MHLEFIEKRLIELGICDDFNGSRGLAKAYLYQIPAMEHSEDAVVGIMPDMTPVQVDEELPGYYKTEVQVIVASKQIQQGNELANEISKGLTFANLSDENVLIKKCQPKHLPAMYRKNASSAYEFSTNFKVVFVNRG